MSSTLRKILAEEGLLRRSSLALLSPADAAWFKGELHKLARKLHAKVVKDTDTSFVFKLPQYPQIHTVTFTQCNREKVLFWMENTDGVAGWGWNEFKPGKPAEPSNFIKMDVLLGLPNPERSLWQGAFSYLQTELKDVKSLSQMKVVTGITTRKDLDPKSQGWSTNPNTYRKPTHYEILGDELDKDSYPQVLAWLKKNKENLLPGRHDYGHGAFDEVTVNWDPRQLAWIVVRYDSYLGG